MERWHTYTAAMPAQFPAINNHSLQPRNMSTMRSSLEKPGGEVERSEDVTIHATNAFTPEDDEEPAVHFKTWIALVSMGVLQFVSLLALVGPPTVVSPVLPITIAPDYYGRVGYCKLTVV